MFAEYLDDDEDWQKINVKDIGTYEHAMFKTRLLFTHPPAYVSLDKYNKLLDGIRNALYQDLKDIKPYLRKLIAEAEERKG